MFPYEYYGVSLLAFVLLLAGCAARLQLVDIAVCKGNETLDGLRGVLAVLVFVSHCVTSYFYWLDGVWRYPDYSLYVHFGQAGVAVFFMITAYLFVGKLLRGRVGWRLLYINRVFRIAPLYVFAVSLLVGISFLVQEFRLNVSAIDFVIGLLKLYSLGIFGVPEINGNVKTWIFIAGTPWTLQYEWIFYFCLPFIAIVLERLGKERFFLVVFLLFVVIVFIKSDSGFVNKHLRILAYFMIGILAVFVSSLNWMKRFAKRRISSFFLVLMLSILGVFFDDSAGMMQSIILGVIFVNIVSGCDFFGLLKMPAMRLLGEISFSLYLLHGLILFLMHFYIFEVVSSGGYWGYWLFSICICLLVIVVSIFTYRCIELPGKDLANSDFLNRLRRFVRMSV